MSFSSGLTWSTNNPLPSTLRWLTEFKIINQIQGDWLDLVDCNLSGQPKMYWVALIKFNLLQINYFGEPIFLFNFKIDTINILNTIFYYNFSYNQYLFIQPKYKIQHVSHFWLIEDICVFSQNMKPGVYLRLVPGLTIVSTYFTTKNIKPYMYLQPVPGLTVANTCFQKAQPIVDTYFLNQNIKSGIYLRPSWSLVSIFLPKIWSPTYTWDLPGYRYLFSYL